MHYLEKKRGDMRLVDDARILYLATPQIDNRRIYNDHIHVRLLQRSTFAQLRKCIAVITARGGRNSSLAPRHHRKQRGD